MSSYNLGVRWCSPTKLCHLTRLYVAVLMQVRYLVAPPALKSGRAKNVQKSVRFTITFEFERKYLWNRWQQRKKSKWRWRERSFGRWTKEILWNSVNYERSYKRSCWPTLSRQWTFGVYQCIWVRATWLWCRENLTHPSNFSQSDLRRRADSRWALPQISSVVYVLPQKNINNIFSTRDLRHAWADRHEILHGGHWSVLGPIL